jgi:hypothetical protein
VVSGAPDWERVFTLVAPSMTHGAPDWERTAVGPSGAPIGGGITPLGQVTAPNTAFNPGGNVAIATLNLTNAAASYAVLEFGFVCQYTTTGANQGFVVEAGGDVTPYAAGWPTLIFAVTPGAAVTNAAIAANWCGLVYLTVANAVIALALAATLHCTGTAVCNGQNVIGAWQ